MEKKSPEKHKIEAAPEAEPQAKRSRSASPKKADEAVKSILDKELKVPGVSTMIGEFAKTTQEVFTIVSIDHGEVDELHQDYKELFDGKEDDLDDESWEEMGGDWWASVKAGRKFDFPDFEAFKKKTYYEEHDDEEEEDEEGDKKCNADFKKILDKIGAKVTTVLQDHGNGNVVMAETEELYIYCDYSTG
mmetsp:Transcript_1506/g.2888  ORF Transcript_1506/g.2888 Transcript_1506/m.2888 type:complete len:190 (-) Transcript_1506:397-966(-)